MSIKTISLNCDICGTKFERKLSEHKTRMRLGYKKVVCSFNCQYKVVSMNNQIIPCKNCNKDVEKRPCDLKSVKNSFCSKSCAAKYNNQFTPKRKPEGVCKQCNKACPKSKTYCSILCMEVYKNQKFLNIASSKLSVSLSSKQPISVLIRSKNTLADYAAKKKDANRYSRVRAHARNTIEHLPKVCNNCGYSKHVECCHKKSISEFKLSDTLAEVNDINNLIFLCKNCHWEADHGELDIFKIPIKT